MKYKYLTFDDRRIIETEYTAGARVQDIADKIGVPAATIYKELARGYTGDLDRNMRSAYSAELAQQKVQQNFKNRGKRGGAKHG